MPMTDMAPHTAKIHTPITLGIHHRAKLLVFEVLKRHPRGFDSHRPLHFQATPAHARLQYRVQDIDPMGKSWESTRKGAVVSLPHISSSGPSIHTYSHTHQFTRINCVIPTLSSDRERPQVAGLDPEPPAATDCYRAA